MSNARYAAVFAQGRGVGLAASIELRILATAAAFLTGVAFAIDPPSSARFTMMFAADATVVILAAACLWLSADRPALALLAVSVLCVAAATVSGSSAALELIVVVVVLQVTVATDLDWRLCAAISVVALTVNDISLRTTAGQSWWGSGLLYPWILTSLAVGLGLQARRLHVAVAELHRLREVDRERARLDERRRIARDLHDVAAHHLTALVVRNKLARRQATFASLDHAAEFSSTTAASALEALRQVVGVLNADGSPARNASDDSSPRAPQPTIDDLAAILERCTAGGLNIQADIATDIDVRRDVEIAIVRLVQEALSNVLAHRGPGRACVVVAGREDVVDVVVSNPLRREQGFNVEQASSNGLGLIGMRERVEACGGSLNIGRDRDAWTISATFPTRVTE